VTARSASRTSIGLWRSGWNGTPNSRENRKTSGSSAVTGGQLEQAQAAPPTRPTSSSVSLPGVIHVNGDESLQKKLWALSAHIPSVASARPAARNHRLNSPCGRSHRRELVLFHETGGAWVRARGATVTSANVRVSDRLVRLPNLLGTHSPPSDRRRKVKSRVPQPRFAPALKRVGHTARPLEDRGDECHRRHQIDGATEPLAVCSSRQFFPGATARGGAHRRALGQGPLRRKNRPQAPSGEGASFRFVGHLEPQPTRFLRQFPGLQAKLKPSVCQSRSGLIRQKAGKKVVT